MPTPYEGEVFTMVLEGSIVIALEGGDEISLDEGDAAYIRATGRRTYRNDGPGTARLLGVIARQAGA